MARLKHKKNFACGHKGFGQKCRRCIDAQKLIDAAGKTRNASARREALIEAAKLKALKGASVTSSDLESVGFNHDEAQQIIASGALLPVKTPEPEPVEAPA